MIDSILQQLPIPLATAAVWGGGGTSQTSSNWAQEGAWGNPKTKTSLGFWDEAASSTPPQRAEQTQKKSLINKCALFNYSILNQTNMITMDYYWRSYIPFSIIIYSLP
jgi:hypothetical protein